MELGFSEMCYYGAIIAVALTILYLLNKKYNTPKIEVKKDPIREELDELKESLYEVRTGFNSLVTQLSGSGEEEEDSQPEKKIPVGGIRQPIQAKQTGTNSSVGSHNDSVMDLGDNDGTEPESA